MCVQKVLPVVRTVWCVLWVLILASVVQCLERHDVPALALGLFPGVCGVRVVVLLCLSVVLAAGSRPVPFRTRKLSLPAPMVLHPGGCGRVGHRRHFSLCVVGWCHPFTAFVGHRPCQGLGGHRVVGVWHHPTFFVPFSRPVARAAFRAHPS